MSQSAPQDLVYRPRLDGIEAVAMIKDLLTAADVHPDLPGTIDRSRRRLAAAQVALESVLRRTHADVPDSGTVREAERALDAAWAATFDWLSGWCKLAAEANPHRAAARAVFTRTFGGALDADELPYRIDRAESLARLEAIDREGHATTFAVLGGAPFLEQLRRAQRQIGPAAGDTTDIREPLAAVAGALRQYVVRVASHADPEVAGSDALAVDLLKPLVRWQRMHPSRAPEVDVGSVEMTTY